MNKNNAVHAIVFEAVAVAIGLEEPDLLAQAGRRGGASQSGWWDGAGRGLAAARRRARARK